MEVKKENLKDLLAEARAIYFAMLNDAITPRQAKSLTKPILRRINSAVVLIAKEHNLKPRKIKFYELGTII